MNVKPLIFFAFLLITCLGCGDDSMIQYPGAPVITLEKTAFDGWERVESPLPSWERTFNWRDDSGKAYAHWETRWDNWVEKETPYLYYRLKAEKLLPYDIEVNLSFQLTYYSDPLTERNEAFRDHMYQQRYVMKADRLTYEDSVAMYSILHLTTEGGVSEVIIRRIRSVVIEILLWTGKGSEPYNVGNPSRIEILRR